MKQQKARSNLDKTIKYIMVIIILAVFIFFAALFIMLLQRSQLILSRYPVWELLFSSEWDPNKGLYGFLPAVTGTFFVTVFSLMIAVPISILNICLQRLNHTFKPLLMCWQEYHRSSLVYAHFLYLFLSRVM